MTENIKVAGIQFESRENDRSYNLNRAAEYIRTNPNYDIYVLPELACSGYGSLTFNNSTMFKNFIYQIVNHIIALPLLCFLIFTNQNKEQLTLLHF